MKEDFPTWAKVVAGIVIVLGLGVVLGLIGFVVWVVASIVNWVTSK